MFYRHTFQVVGVGRFPVDMLRYDACYPVSEARDSSAIQNALAHEEPPEVPQDVLLKFSLPNGPKKGWVVTLAHDTTDKQWKPTDARWASFLWRVIPGSHAVEKR